MNEEKLRDLTERSNPFLEKELPAKIVNGKEEGVYIFKRISKNLVVREVDSKSKKKSPANYTVFAVISSPSGKEGFTDLESIVKYFESLMNTSNSSR